FAGGNRDGEGIGYDAQALRINVHQLMMRIGKLAQLIVGQRKSSDDSLDHKEAPESKSGIKAAVFDIVDTVFDIKEKRFIPSAIEGLKKLREKGILVILATGRPPQTALSICEEGVCP